SDQMDPVQRHFIKLIRGETAYHAFDKAFENGARQFVLKEIRGYQDVAAKLVDRVEMKTAQSVSDYFSDGGIFPGVFPYAESSHLLWTEPEIHQETAMCEQKVRTVRSPAHAEVACRFVYESAARR